MRVSVCCQIADEAEAALMIVVFWNRDGIVFGVVESVGDGNDSRGDAVVDTGAVDVACEWAGEDGVMGMGEDFLFPGLIPFCDSRCLGVPHDAIGPGVPDIGDPWEVEGFGEFISGDKAGPGVAGGPDEVEMFLADDFFCGGERGSAPVDIFFDAWEEVSRSPGETFGEAIWTEV